jgi:ectoine hydroxylase-related dioxygenase (phytanoyl-CoA dioxygenase family)
MSIQISPEQLAQYREEGGVMIRGVFNADWVSKITQAVLRTWKTFDGGQTPETLYPSPTQNLPTMGTTIYGGVELRNCAPCQPEFRDWIDNSPAASTVAAVTGASSVRFWMDSTFIKEPETGEDATPWHTDGCTYPWAGDQIPTMWMALTDVDEDNAPLMTIAGSHKLPYRFHSGLSRQDMELEGYRPWQELLDIAANPGDKLRVWTAKAGDMLLFHPQMIHGSKPRKAGVPGRRIGFSTRWIGSDARWKPDAFSAKIPILLENPKLIPGEAPPEDVFPIVWREAA